MKARQALTAPGDAGEPLLRLDCAISKGMGRQIVGCHVRQVPRLLEGVASRSPQHCEMLLRLAVTGLQAYAVLPPASQLGAEAELAARREGLRGITSLVRGRPD